MTVIEVINRWEKKQEIKLLWDNMMPVSRSTGKSMIIQNAFITSMYERLYSEEFQNEIIQISSRNNK